MVRVAAGAGSWGDDISEARELLQRSEVDYLVLDYLAEVTLSIMQGQREKDPAKGYATDFLLVLRDIAPFLKADGVRIVTNAGGLNPEECARQVTSLLSALGISPEVRVAVIDGDDLMPQLDTLAERNAFSSLDDQRPFSTVAKSILSANAYLGAEPIRRALALGARIVVTGRCADVSLTVGPLLHEFGWSDWDCIAGGVVAGHLLECGPQSTGGNSHMWSDIPGLDHVGYPIAEVASDGSFTLTKAEGSGGRVNGETVTEQLLHEIFDPAAVLTPDATVDWRTIRLEECGPDRVRVSGVKGRPPPPTLKVSMTYGDGYRVILQWPYAWPHAVAKAQAALDRISRTVQRLGIAVQDSRRDIFGTGAIHGPRLDHAQRAGSADPPEVFARYAARIGTLAQARTLSAQQAPMLYGPQGLAGHIAGGRGQVSKINSHWATTVDATHVSPRIRILPRAEPCQSNADC